MEERRQRLERFARALQRVQRVNVPRLDTRAKKICQTFFGVIRAHRCVLASVYR